MNNTNRVASLFTLARQFEEGKESRLKNQLFLLTTNPEFREIFRQPLGQKFVDITSDLNMNRAVLRRKMVGTFLAE